MWSVYLHPLRKYERRRKVLKMGWFGVFRGHPRSLKIATFDRARTFLLAFHSNCVPILHRFWDIARYWPQSADLNLPNLYLAPPLGVMSLEFRQDFWHRKTWVSGLSYGVVSLILGLAIFVQLRLVTDGQTDGQTHDDSWYRASIASRGKNPYNINHHTQSMLSHYLWRIKVQICKELHGDRRLVDLLWCPLACQSLASRASSLAVMCDLYAITSSFNKTTHLHTGQTTLCDFLSRQHPLSFLQIRGRRIAPTLIGSITRYEATSSSECISRSCRALTNRRSVCWTFGMAWHGPGR